jgi:hypothetical protein
MKHFSALFFLVVSFLMNASFAKGITTKKVMQCSMNGELAIEIYEQTMEDQKRKIVQLKFIPLDNNKLIPQNNGKRLVDEVDAVLSESIFVVADRTANIENATGYKGDSISAVLSEKDGKIIIAGKRGSGLMATYSGLECR